ncbi:MAG: hypothetical protein VYA54_09675 [Bdellovibrionota bacterium]|nr:hypothetical protein [Bdellovibrionota bacterium]
MIRILTLLTLSTLTLASENSEKCILDTPDGLKKSLVENFSELAEKGYKPCSEKVSWMGGDHEGIDSRYSLPSKINDREFRTCAEATDPAEKVLYVLNELGVFEARRVDKKEEKIYDGDFVYYVVRNEEQIEKLKKHKWLKFDESKLPDDKVYEYRTQKAIEYYKSKSKKYSRYYELKKDDPKAKIALYNLVLSSSDGISGIKTSQDYKERPMTKGEARELTLDYRTHYSMSPDGIEESVERKIANCKVTEYEDLKHVKCYDKESHNELISAQLVSKENKYLTWNSRSYGIWDFPFTFKFKGVRYYLYIGGYEGYTFFLYFSIAGKVYYIRLPRKCNYFDVYPVS